MRTFPLAISFLLLAAAAPAPPHTPPPEKPTLICTVFPVYDWARVILGHHAQTDVNLLFLQNHGLDLHNYAPTAPDLQRLASCRLFVFIGGPSDAWVPAALASTPNPNRMTLNLLETLRSTNPKKEKNAPIDEHLWLSLRNAQRLLPALAAKITAADPPHAADYQTRTAAYTAQLASLDAQYTAAFAAAPQKILLFADRFPFRCLASDYNLTCLAAFPGCSAESEASFQTIASLARQIDALNLHSILVIEGPNHKLASTLIANTTSKNQQILTLDSLQSTDAHTAQSKSYLETMRANLQTLLQALSP